MRTGILKLMRQTCSSAEYMGAFTFSPFSWQRKEEASLSHRPWASKRPLYLYTNKIISIVPLADGFKPTIRFDSQLGREYAVEKLRVGQTIYAICVSHRHKAV